MDSLGMTLFRVLGVALIIGAAVFAHREISRRLGKETGSLYRSQLATMGIVLAALILVVVVFPFNDTVRGDVLGLIGILISAMIALSSATFVSNVMAGAMLRTIKSCRPGAYIEIADHFGRITEMDLLHCEIQTEERDLITLSNLFMVTNPTRVLRSSGTIVSVTLSLGYDVPRQKIEKHLLAAAEEAGLESPFVQIIELGDFSVTYRISGLLTDLGKLLSTRRLLRATVLDQLHNNDIEIVSPTFMSQRQFDNTTRFMPARVYDTPASPKDIAPDDVVFDKAAKAETVEALRARYEETNQKYKDLEAELKAATDETIKVGLSNRLAALEAQRDRWQKVVAAREEVLKQEK